MQQRRSRWLATAVAGLTAAMALSACGAGSGSGSSGDPVRIGIGIDAAYAPFFVADHDGMFKKAGLDVKLIQFGRGGEAVQAIAGNQVEMAGNSDTTTITLMAQNPALRALYIYEQSGKYLKVVARPGVKDAGDIKKMGVVPGLSDYMARKYFESNQIDPDSVKFIEADPPELPTLTKKGTVDAYLLWEPWPAKGKDIGLNILTDTGSYGYSYVHWLVAGSDWLKGHEGEAAKIAEVLAKAEKIVAEDPDRAAKAVKDEAKIPESDAKTAIEQVDWKVRGFTADDIASYEDQVKYFMDKGVLKEPLDLKSSILTSWFTDNVKTS